MIDWTDVCSYCKKQVNTEVLRICEKETRKQLDEITEEEMKSLQHCDKCYHKGCSSKHELVLFLRIQQEMRNIKTRHKRFLEDSFHGSVQDTMKMARGCKEKLWNKEKEFRGIGDVGVANKTLFEWKNAVEELVFLEEMFKSAWMVFEKRVKGVAGRMSATEQNRLSAAPIRERVPSPAVPSSRTPIPTKPLPSPANVPPHQPAINGVSGNLSMERPSDGLLPLPPGYANGGFAKGAKKMGSSSSCTTADDRQRPIDPQPRVHASIAGPDYRQPPEFASPRGRTMLRSSDFQKADRPPSRPPPGVPSDHRDAPPPYSGENNRYAPPPHRDTSALHRSRSVPPPRLRYRGFAPDTPEATMEGSPSYDYDNDKYSVSKPVMTINALQIEKIYFEDRKIMVRVKNCSDQKMAIKVNWRRYVNVNTKQQTEVAPNEEMTLVADLNSEIDEQGKNGVLNIRGKSRIFGDGQLQFFLSFRAVKISWINGEWVAEESSDRVV